MNLKSNLGKQSAVVFFAGMKLVWAAWINLSSLWNIISLYMEIRTYLKMVYRLSGWFVVVSSWLLVQRGAEPENEYDGWPLTAPKREPRAISLRSSLSSQLRIETRKYRCRCFWLTNSEVYTGGQSIELDVCLCMSVVFHGALNTVCSPFWPQWSLNSLRRDPQNSSLLFFSLLPFPCFAINFHLSPAQPCRACKRRRMRIIHKLPISHMH